MGVRFVHIGDTTTLQGKKRPVALKPGIESMYNEHLSLELSKDANRKDLHKKKPSLELPHTGSQK